MVLVHALVAEVLANLIDTLEAAHDETLQVQLCGNTAIEVDVQTVVVCDEGTCACTTSNALQDGSLYLGITSLIQTLAQGADNLCTLQEGFLNTLVYDEVNIALTETQFGVGECVKHITL